MQIKDTAAIVTGAASGMGAATARALAERGARVFALDLAGGIAKAPEMDGVTYLAADVTDPEQLQRAVGLAADSGLPLRTAINCAGIAPTGPMLPAQGRYDLGEFRRSVEVNLIGTFNLMVLAAEVIAKTDPVDEDTRGVIINTASMVSLDGPAQSAAYSAAKAGVYGLTLPSAREFADRGIRVMAISPGVFDTPMTQANGVADMLGPTVPFPKRAGHPDEYARLAVHIVENDYLNGGVIRLDGAKRMAA
ncbi:SDR family NAD(P)-dependent oxidoreductase [Streptomyces paludis]|uniref:SDR family NAD(P)-dependent oxidoreductase n=1 Tax=Streptomyces paludis TaxID=2282738 RepID=A0A345HLX8_9ACTN|nr:SDR family NAD(P)-dependent oxidoreductase [Streptomyces paludis]AXG77702.1 SDR family NAD(P)-dependent oxidoreductase [Streptomyces paludis]